MSRTDGVACRIYDRLCADCHGATGRGDGEKAKKLAAAGEPKAPDLTDDKWDHGSTDGEIFVDIRDGLGSTMTGLNGKPGIGPEEIWHLVNYVRSLVQLHGMRPIISSP